MSWAFHVSIAVVGNPATKITPARARRRLISRRARTGARSTGRDTEGRCRWPPLQRVERRTLARCAILGQPRSGQLSRSAVKRGGHHPQSNSVGVSSALSCRERPGRPPPLNLRYVIFGGEALDPTELASWFARHGDTAPRLVNMYGITETTVHVTYRPLAMADAACAASVIGQPIPDLYLRVLDEHFEPVPPGVPGELFVGGAGIARGYLRRDELTAAHFLTDPHRSGQRLYRSGSPS